MHTAGYVSTCSPNQEEFTKYRIRLDKYFTKIEAQARGPRLELTYEADIMNKRISPILDFLGADSRIATFSPKRKQLSRSIAERFDDPAQVSSYLQKIGRPEWEYE